MSFTFGKATRLSGANDHGTGFGPSSFFASTIPADASSISSTFDPILRAGKFTLKLHRSARRAFIPAICHSPFHIVKLGDLLAKEWGQRNA